MYNKLQYLICGQPAVKCSLNSLELYKQAGKQSNENKLRVVTYSNG